MVQDLVALYLLLSQDLVLQSEKKLYLFPIANGIANESGMAVNPTASQAYEAQEFSLADIDATANQFVLKFKAGRREGNWWVRRITVCYGDVETDTEDGSSPRHWSLAAFAPKPGYRVADLAVLQNAKPDTANPWRNGITVDGFHAFSESGPVANIRVGNSKSDDSGLYVIDTDDIDSGLALGLLGSGGSGMELVLPIALDAPRPLMRLSVSYHVGELVNGKSSALYFSYRTLDDLMTMDAADAEQVAAKKQKYFDYADFTGVEAEKAESMARFGVAVDQLIAQFNLKAVAIRCWDELEKRYGIAPCLAMSVLNEAGIAAACEMDVNNAVMMRAVALASDSPVGLFDVNNNYGDATDRAIMFHCSAIPGSMLTCKGCIDEHLMFKKAYGPRTGVGIFGGPVKEMPLTVGSFKTENGRLCGFVTEGEVTGDKLEKAFFGTGFVFKKADGRMNDLFNYMAENGYRHHVAFAYGQNADVVREALVKYLGYEVTSV